MPPRWSLSLIVALLVAGSGLHAVSQDLAARLRDAESAHAAGRSAEALALVDQLLVLDPTHSRATLLKVTLLLDHDRGGHDRVGEALSAYDAYVAARRSPDDSLLRAIALAELRAQALDPDAAINVPALERLALAGDAPARQSLRGEVGPGLSPGIDRLGALTSLAKLGDARAVDALGALLTDVSPDRRVEVVQAIQDANARSHTPKVVSLLSDPDPLVRMSAARALGHLQASSAIPQVKKMFDQDLPTVRILVAVALRRLGQSSVDPFLSGLLASETAEVRLLAAEAYQATKTTEWLSRLRQLAGTPNPQHRVRAAELLACCDPSAARALLADAIRSANPLLRSEAARVLEAYKFADAALIRQLLGDSHVRVRLYGAGAALAGAPSVRAGR